MTNHIERMQICLSGELPDRSPVALWRHFPVDDQSPESLARATLAWQEWFDFDLVKVTPESSFCLKDWGAQDEWNGATEGTRTYTQRVIQHPEDWLNLTPLDPEQGYLAGQLTCLRLVCERLAPETPVIQTIFNPLSQAKNLVGAENLILHLRQFPDAVHAGLKTIVESSLRFIEAARTTGIAGIFYAIQHAQHSLLTVEEYRQFGRVYDLQVLEAAQDMWLNMLHLHGNDVMFNDVCDYPVQVLNWHDQETFPSLSVGQMLFPGTVCGGIRREKSLVLGNPQAIRLDARQAIGATGGRRFILGTGCVTPITAPYGNILALRQSVEAWSE